MQRRKPHLQIRTEVRKGRECYKVVGRDEWNRSIGVHGLTRHAAEHIKGKLLRGEEITLADYTPAPRLTVLAGGIR